MGFTKKNQVRKKTINEYTHLVIGEDTITLHNGSIDVTKIRSESEAGWVNDSVFIITFTKYKSTPFKSIITTSDTVRWNAVFGNSYTGSYYINQKVH